MSLPESHEDRICPECGAALPANAKYCWLCRGEAQPVAEAAAPSSPFAEHRAAYQFSLSSLMLTITLVAVLLGVFRIAAGLGIVLTILVTPAFLRTCITTARRKARGQPVSLGAKLRLFASTFGIAVGSVIIVVAAVVAAVSTYCGIVLLGDTHFREMAGPAFLVLLGALGAIAIVVAIFTACWRLSRRRGGGASNGSRAQE